MKTKYLVFILLLIQSFTLISKADQLSQGLESLNKAIECSPKDQSIAINLQIWEDRFPGKAIGIVLDSKTGKIFSVSPLNLQGASAGVPSAFVARSFQLRGNLGSQGCYTGTGGCDAMFTGLLPNASSGVVSIPVTCQVFPLPG